MAREDDQLKFRVPKGLKATLEKAATANLRSLNAEIIARLEASFGADAERSKSAAAKLLKIGMPDGNMAARVAALEARVAKLEKAGDK